jgi:hypothetical protein
MLFEPLIRRPRAEMFFSRPAKAPPQTNSILVVSACRNSCWLAAALRGHRGDDAFRDLEERPLHAQRCWSAQTPSAAAFRWRA